MNARWSASTARATSATTPSSPCRRAACSAAASISDAHAVARVNVRRARLIHAHDDLPRTVGLDPQKWDAGRGQIAGIGEALGHQTVERGAQGRKGFGRRGDADGGPRRREMRIGAFDARLGLPRGARPPPRDAHPPRRVPDRWPNCARAASRCASAMPRRADVRPPPRSAPFAPASVPSRRRPRWPAPAPCAAVTSRASSVINHVTGANPVSGIDVDGGNRRDESTRDRCGFPCGNDAAGFEPLGRVDRRHRSDGDRDRLPAFAWGRSSPLPQADRPPASNTEHDDSNQSIHDHHVLGSADIVSRAARARARAPRSGESRPFRRLWPATRPPAPPRRLAARRSRWPARPRTDRG